MYRDYFRNLTPPLSYRSYQSLIENKQLHCLHFYKNDRKKGTLFLKKNDFIVHKSAP